MSYFRSLKDCANIRSKIEEEINKLISYNRQQNGELARLASVQKDLEKKFDLVERAYNEYNDEHIFFSVHDKEIVKLKEQIADLRENFSERDHDRIEDLKKEIVELKKEFNNWKCEDYTEQENAKQIAELEKKVEAIITDYETLEIPDYDSYIPKEKTKPVYLCSKCGKHITEMDFKGAWCSMDVLTKILEGSKEKELIEENGNVY